MPILRVLIALDVIKAHGWGRCLLEEVCVGRYVQVFVVGHTDARYESLPS